MKDVKVEHRNNAVEYLRMALNQCELPVSYMQTELIMMIVDELNIRGGKYSLMDGAKIYTEWQKKYDDYFKSLEDDKRQDDSSGVPQSNK